MPVLIPLREIEVAGAEGIPDGQSQAGLPGVAVEVTVASLSARWSSGEQRRSVLREAAFSFSGIQLTHELDRVQ